MGSKGIARDINDMVRAINNLTVLRIHCLGRHTFNRLLISKVEVVYRVGLVVGGVIEDNLIASCGNGDISLTSTYDGVARDFSSFDSYLILKGLPVYSFCLEKFLIGALLQILHCVG